ncbi:MAG: hypothetical protein ACJ76I_16465, partial [Gaiellaceae bacterium]
QAGDDDYNATDSAEFTVTLHKAAQALAFSQPTANTMPYGVADFVATAASNQGQTPVTYSGSNQCTVTDKHDGTATVSLTNVGSCTITASQAGNADYLLATKSITITITVGVGRVAYIGQTDFVTSGSSATSAQVTLTASVMADGGSIANAKVTFTDLLSNKVLASGVKVSPVVGSTSPTGTANTVVTLSTGQYGEQAYLIQVKLDTVSGSPYKNCQQLPVDEDSCGTATAGSAPYNAAHPTVFARIPPTVNSLQGGGSLAKLTTAAGKYGDALTAQFSAGMNYTSKGTNAQGQIQLILTRADGTYYVKSNSISSVAFAPANATTRTDVTTYTKASILKVTSTGTVSIDGGVTLRMDAHDGGTSNDTIGFTVLSSKDSSLYYSNNWAYDSTTASWKTVLQSLDPTSANFTIK